MTKNEIIDTLKQLANEQYKRILLKHLAKEPCLGVKFAELTILKKKIGTNHALAQELYKTGIFEAMYLAGLIADATKMSKKDLENWCTLATSPCISEHTVQLVASQSSYGLELALQWIDSTQEYVAACGWATLARIVADTEQNALSQKQITNLMNRVISTISQSAPRVRYTMNGFIIGVGVYRDDFLEKALEAANKIGKVSVPMPGTACKVPFASDYIKKVRLRLRNQRIGKN